MFCIVLYEKKNYFYSKQSCHVIKVVSMPKILNGETKSFDKTNDSLKKIIIVERSMKARRNEKGYLMIGVKEFLLAPNSLDL